MGWGVEVGRGCGGGVGWGGMTWGLERDGCMAYPFYVAESTQDLLTPPPPPPHRKAGVQVSSVLLSKKGLLNSCHTG